MPKGANRDVWFVDAGPSLVVLKRGGELWHTTFSGFDPRAGHVVGRFGLRVGV